jgi:hypothetical protein
MQIPSGTFCPLLKKDCIAHKCVWFIKLAGTEKNTGKEIEEYFCAISALPLLLIENAQMSRETGAAVESFRNEMVKSNQAQQLLTAAAIRTKMLEIE